MTESRSAVTLLFVEDDRGARGIVSQLISRKFPGITVVTAEDGEAGLQLFEKHQPEIVLTDIHMPVMSGIEMIRRIRNHNSKVPIIAATALSDSALLLEAIKLGIRQYVVKPISFRLLLEVIGDCLQQITMERQLKEQHDFIRKLSRAVESNPTMIALANAEGILDYVNPKFCATSGYSPEESIGRSLEFLVADAAPPLAFEQILETVNRGAEWRGEFLNKKKNGELYHHDLAVSALKDENGDVTHFVAVMQDITEIHQARQEMLKAQKLESLSLLAGGIAHDFNNILTGILGSITLARFQHGNPEKMEPLLSGAESAALRARNLTQQLLTFAKGGAPIKKVIPLKSLLQEAAEFALHGANVRCNFEISEELWPVEADEGQLAQVIHNLILNAVQAMPDGGTVSISAANLEERHGGKRLVRIAVDDTGIGIPQQQLPKIFDPYFSTKELGSGLGLATCYSIVKKHGGSIEARSTPGKGTSIEVTLPAAIKVCQPPASLSPGLSGGSGKILLLDDEKEVREIGAAMLEELGYEVESAEDGAEAIERYAQAFRRGEAYAAVIMDLTIRGGMGGKRRWPGCGNWILRSKGSCAAGTPMTL